MRRCSAELSFLCIPYISLSGDFFVSFIFLWISLSENYFTQTIKKSWTCNSCPTFRVRPTHYDGFTATRKPSFSRLHLWDDFWKLLSSISWQVEPIWIEQVWLDSSSPYLLETSVNVIKFHPHHIPQRDEKEEGWRLMESLPGILTGFFYFAKIRPRNTVVKKMIPLCMPWRYPNLGDGSQW